MEPETTAQVVGHAVFYIVIYAVGLSVLGVATLAYAYWMSALFAKAASTPSKSDDHRGTRRES